MLNDLPSETDTTAVAHAVTKDLAGQDGVAKEDGTKFLTASVIVSE
jgi:hypothetical protein